MIDYRENLAAQCHPAANMNHPAVNMSLPVMQKSHGLLEGKALRGGHTLSVRRGLRNLGAALLLATGLAGLTGCGPGARPVLIEGDTLLVSASDLAASLNAAPAGTVPLTIPQELLFQATVEDALDHWATRSQTAYRGDCSTPLFGEAVDTEVALCSTGTARPTVIHLGPDTSTPWYVVTLTETTAGVKVTDTAIAGT